MKKKKKKIKKERKKEKKKRQTHITLINLLPFIGVSQRTDTQIRDGHSCAWGNSNQHQQGPWMLFQRQLQAVGLLCWQSSNVNVASGTTLSRVN